MQEFSFRSILPKITHCSSPFFFFGLVFNENRRLQLVGLSPPLPLPLPCTTYYYVLRPLPHYLPLLHHGPIEPVGKDALRCDSEACVRMCSATTAASIPGDVLLGLETRESFADHCLFIPGVVACHVCHVSTRETLALSVTVGEAHTSTTTVVFVTTRALRFTLFCILSESVRRGCTFKPTRSFSSTFSLRTMPGMLIPKIPGY